MGAQVKLIRENSLQVTEDGFRFDIRLNWYRSLPLSSVEIHYIKIDGETVPVDQIRFEINQHSYTPAELIEQFEEIWFVQDFASLHVRQPGRIHQGETHSLETEISLRFPYMNIGPGKFLTNATHYTCSQTAQ